MSTVIRVSIDSPVKSDFRDVVCSPPSNHDPDDTGDRVFMEGCTGFRKDLVVFYFASGKTASHARNSIVYVSLSIFTGRCNLSACFVQVSQGTTLVLAVDR